MATVVGQQVKSPDLSQEHLLSSEQGKNYLIKVQLPITYQDSIDYPVLYYLDAWWLEDSVVGAFTLLQGSRKVRAAILVGISTTGNEYEFNKQRTRDYTPTPFEMEKLGFPMVIFSQPKFFEITRGNSGSSELFTSFLTNILFPFIDGTYNTDIKDRSILGHSLGGLFGIHNLSSAQPTFDNYISISPSLWWIKDDNYYESLYRNFSNEVSKKKLFLCYGSSEGLLITTWTDKLNEYLLTKGLPVDHFKFVKYPDEDHTSVLPESIYEGLEFLYGYSK
ncbi:putative esterase [Nonlabens marinus S1-08]|uniref:Putative esterase n=2 Tax=Nonlabens TaxID=363408 RepID=W8VXM5_9FLAO|nr:putative esterase [Nonlabens marinus S1-08]